MEINITSVPTEFSAYIDGADTIRLDRKSVYYLQGTNEINGEVIFDIDSSLASIIETNNNKCVVHANNKNQLGEVILLATYDGKTYEKTIRIVPLW